MRRFKSFLLIFVALWLPIQAASAAALPFCRHAAESLAQEVIQHETMHVAVHCHEQAEMSANDHAAGSSVDCDNCEMCHLATAGYLPVCSAKLMPEAASVLIPALILSQPSHIGEPPQQPPRHL